MARARAFGTIRKLPSGRYQARCWHLGKQVAAETTFQTKADARAWLSAVETDIRRGDHVEPITTTIKFGDYAREWLNNRPLRPRTLGTYESQLVHILRTFERAEIGDIASKDVRVWFGKLTRSGMSRNTAAKVYRLFRTIMGTAVEDGLLRSNPVAIKGAASERIAERPLLTWDDVARLAESIEPKFLALVWTAAASGLRFGELTGLDRSRIDLGNRTIRVDRALAAIKGDGPVLGPPKSAAAYRTVALPAQACEILAAHMETYVAASSESLIFTSVKGSPLLNRYFAPYWQLAKISADVDQTVRFHDFRHLAGTTAASAGGSLREIMARMGHASSDAALRYLKAAEDRDRELAVAIGDRISSVRSQG